MKRNKACPACSDNAMQYIPPAAPGGGAWYCVSCGCVRPLSDKETALNNQLRNCDGGSCAHERALCYLADPEGLGLSLPPSALEYIRRHLERADRAERDGAK